MNMTEQQATDWEWVARAKEGDERAFRELVEHYEGQVAATVVGMLGRGDEADDVGQETFIRFYESLGAFRGEAAVGTYLTRIAINLALNAIERRKRMRWRFWSRDDEDNAPVEPGFDARDARATLESGEEVHAALQKLKPDFRAVVVLRMLEGYSTKETAALLEIAEGTVLSRLSRGMKHLQRIFKNEVDAT
ncbi:MAG: RNA polymerase sigma-70 factor (ECF subfamily) [Candidatus Latescibacterota bacterium]|jgi:RNA polymerase sigma-70 factor (ECF subfamily)